MTSTERGLVIASGMAWSNVSRLWLSCVGCPSSPATTLRKCMSWSVLNAPVYMSQFIFSIVSVIGNFLYKVTTESTFEMCACRNFADYRLALTLLHNHVLKIFQCFGRLLVPTSAHPAQGQKGCCASEGVRELCHVSQVDKEQYAE
jgi:hypothetical protein